MTEPSTNSAAPSLDSNQLIAVCKALYRECVTALGTNTDEISKISMETFVNWCVENNLPMVEEAEMTRLLNLMPDCCKAVDAIFRGSPWQCAAILYPVWFTVVLQHRPPLETGIAFIHAAFTVGYRDERVGQVKCALPMEPGMTNTDGYLLTLFGEFSNVMLQQLSHLGLDRIHDEYAQLVQEHGSQVDSKAMPNFPGKVGFN